MVYLMTLSGIQTIWHWFMGWFKESFRLPSCRMWWHEWYLVPEHSPRRWRQQVPPKHE